MPSAAAVFYRPELARKLVRQILQVGVGSAAGSGVFLAAPRRTGKSTFARVDLPFPLDAAQVWPLFAAVGCQPELLGAAGDRFGFDFELGPAAGPQQFAEEVRRLAAEMVEVQRKVIHSMTPIQSAVLRVMAACGNNYAPFEAATMGRYRLAMQLAGLPPDEVKADVPGVQQALIALQEKKLVWRAARGMYALEEQGSLDLLRDEGLLDGLD
jgi:hypothetical protein